MTTWTIYSIGDAAMLTQVLNAIAALCATPDMLKLTGIGFIIGILYVAIDAIMKGAREIQFQSFLMAYIGYMVMFGMHVSVVVQDAYTDQTYVVGNVPLGVGIPGAWLSQIGYGMTNLFEEAFSTPTMMKDGFAGSLQVLTQLRKFNTVGTALNMGPGHNENIDESASNFVNDCVVKNLGGTVDQNSVQTSTDFFGNLSGQMNPNDSTVLYITEAQGRPSSTPAPNTTNPMAMAVSCDDALKAMQTRVQATMSNPQLAASFSAQNGCDQATISNNTCNKVDQLQNALTMLAQSGDNAQTVLANAYMGYWFAQALSNQLSANNVAPEAMIYQADTQRATSEAANTSLFARMIRPMLSFMEVFTYGTTPIVMFLVGVGAMGFKMIFRYLQMAMWIQLWLPLMALLNFYVNFTVQGKLAAFAVSTGLDPGSVLGIANMGGFEDFMATVGIIATSIPALAMFLIYGGTVAASAVAGRLQAGNFVNEKIMSPDLIKPPAQLDMSAMGRTMDTFRGERTTGAEGTLSTVNVSQTLAAAAQSSHTQALTEGNSLINSVGRLTSSDASQSSSRIDSERLSESLRSGNSESFAAMQRYAESQAESFGMDRSQATDISNREFAQSVSSNTATLSAKASADAGVGIPGGPRAGAGVGMGVTHENRESTGSEGASNAQARYSASAGQLQQKLHEFGKSEEFRSALSRDLAHEFAKGSESRVTQGLSESDTKSLQAQSQRVLQSSEQFAETQSLARNMASSVSRDTASIAQQAISTGTTSSVEGIVHDHLRAPGGDESMERYYSNWMAKNGQHFQNPEQRKLIGMMEALNNSQASSPMIQEMRQGTMAKILKATGIASPESSNPFAGQEATSHAPGGITNTVSGRSFDGTRQQIAAAASTLGPPSNGDQAVLAHDAQGRGDVSAASDRYHGSVAADRVSKGKENVAKLERQDVSEQVRDPKIHEAQQIAGVVADGRDAIGLRSDQFKTRDPEKYVHAVSSAANEAAANPLLSKVPGVADLSYDKSFSYVSDRVGGDRDFSGLYAAARSQALVDPNGDTKLIAEHFRPAIEAKFGDTPADKQASQRAIENVIGAARSGDDSKLDQVGQFVRERQGQLGENTADMHLWGR